MVELVDTLLIEGSAEMRIGSNPIIKTKINASLAQ